MNFLKNPGLVVRFLIAIGYILLSILFFFSPITSETLTKNLKYAFCALLMIYGLYRVYRAYQLYKELNDEQ